MILNTDDKDRETSHLSKIIAEAATQSVPQKLNRIQPPKLPTHITNLINKKNKLRALWQTHRTRGLKAVLNRYYTFAHHQLTVWRNTQGENKLKSLDLKDNSFWKVTKFFNTQNQQTGAPLTSANSAAYTDEDKAEVLATHYTNIHASTLNNGNPSFVTQINASTNKLLKSHTRLVTAPPSIKLVFPKKLSPSFGN